METRVQNVEDLIGIDPELQAIRIARTIGARKRVEILAIAAERGIHVLNPRTLRMSEDFKENEETKEKGKLSVGAKKK